MMSFKEDNLDYGGTFIKTPIIVLLFQCIAINSNHQVLVHRPFG